jgi:hypothetical protein
VLRTTVLKTPSDATTASIAVSTDAEPTTVWVTVFGPVSAGLTPASAAAAARA